MAAKSIVIEPLFFRYNIRLYDEQQLLNRLQMTAALFQIASAIVKQILRQFFSKTGVLHI